jgi:hypothetical protein
MERALVCERARARACVCVCVLNFLGSECGQATGSCQHGDEPLLSIKLREILLVAWDL